MMHSIFQVGRDPDGGSFPLLIDSVLNEALRWKQQLRFAILRQVRQSYSTTPLLGEEGNKLLHSSILNAQPFMAGKIGAYELQGVRWLLRHRPMTWVLRRRLHVNAGVFPPTNSNIAKWAELFVLSLQNLDLLGVWNNPGEARTISELKLKCSLMWMRGLEPYYFSNPWSSALSGRRVSVVSPFAETIENQYKRRAEIWGDRAILPEMTLTGIKSPFSAGIVPPQHKDWFAAFDALKLRIESEAPEVVLVGAGAFSLPLCSFAKTQLGCAAIHTGGWTQLLFGIKGHAWDKHPVISSFFNEAWVRPSSAETPPTAKRVERGRYW